MNQSKAGGEVGCVTGFSQAKEILVGERSKECFPTFSQGA